jgi:hypothetical protein
MIDLKFIQFFISVKYQKSIEEYYNVQKSTVSNWRNRGMNTEKDFSSFYTYSNRISPYCKICTNFINNENKKKNKDKIEKQQKEYRKKNKQKKNYIIF